MIAFDNRERHQAPKKDRREASAGSIQPSTMAAMHQTYIAHPPPAAPFTPTAQDLSLDWMIRFFFPHIPHVLAYPVSDEAEMNVKPAPAPFEGRTDALSSKCDRPALVHPPQRMCSCLLFGSVCEGTAALKRLRSSAPVPGIAGAMNEIVSVPPTDMNAAISLSVLSMAGKQPSDENAVSRLQVKRKLAESLTAPSPVLPPSQSVIALSSIRSLSRSELASFVADVVDARTSALTYAPQGATGMIASRFSLHPPSHPAAV
jgi:hypothetical protein